MADVFISYKREDRKRIEPLAQALERQGYTVWWDLEILPSQKFERQIKRELDAARCVIVVWTDRSVADDGMYASDWVQIEANSGDARGVLLPVQLDAGRTHWRHGQIQFVALHNWNGDDTATNFAELLRGVEMHAGARERPADMELADWQAIEKTEQVDGFKRFLELHPSSRFAKIARGRIEELEEFAEWRNLGPAPTLDGLEGFLKRFPTGRFSDDIEARIRAMGIAITDGVTSGADVSPHFDGDRLPAATHRNVGKIYQSRKANRGFYFGLVSALIALLAFASNWAGNNASSPVEELPAPSEPEPPSGEMPSAPPIIAPSASPKADPRAFRDCPSCPEMVLVPAGSFVMGSPLSEPDRQIDEGPQRTVNVSTFAAGRFEVTLEEWDACVAGGGCRNNPSPMESRREFGVRHPVSGVSWHDAQEYIQWLNRKTNQRYRLMTEAEWEYAARAGSNSPFWWGSEIQPWQAQYYWKWPYNGGPRATSPPGVTAPVGSFRPNPFGLYDVHGNVWEWVEDCAVRSLVGAPIDGTAVANPECFLRVVRGGSFDNYPELLRSANRDWRDPSDRHYGIGFRLAKTVPPTLRVPTGAGAAPSVSSSSPEPLYR